MIMAIEKKNNIPHSQSTSKETKDLRDIEDGNQDSHGASKGNIPLTLIDLERILEEWRLNVAICTTIGNE